MVTYGELLQILDFARKEENSGLTTTQLATKCQKHLEYLKSDEYKLEIVKGMDNFICEDDIEDIPIFDNMAFYREKVVPLLIEKGALPKSELKPFCKYVGGCRNTTIAEWTGEYFRFKRWKFGWSYVEHIDHFEDCKGGEDVFIPIRKVDD